MFVCEYGVIFLVGHLVCFCCNFLVTVYNIVGYE